MDRQVRLEEPPVGYLMGLRHRARVVVSWVVLQCVVGCPAWKYGHADTVQDVVESHQGDTDREGCCLQPSRTYLQH